MASNDAMLLHAQGLNQNLGKLVETFATRFALSSTTGSFPLAGAATTTVNDANVKSGSIIMLSATNATAGALMGSGKSLYISAKVEGASFTVATADGTAASGGQTFDYVILNAG